MCLHFAIFSAQHRCITVHKTEIYPKRKRHESNQSDYRSIIFLLRHAYQSSQSSRLEHRVKAPPTTHPSGPPYAPILLNARRCFGTPKLRQSQRQKSSRQLHSTAENIRLYPFHARQYFGTPKLHKQRSLIHLPCTQTLSRTTRHLEQAAHAATRVQNLPELQTKIIKRRRKTIFSSASLPPFSCNRFFTSINQILQNQLKILISYKPFSQPRMEIVHPPAIQGLQLPPMNDPFQIPILLTKPSETNHYAIVPRKGSVIYKIQYYIMEERENKIPKRKRVVVLIYCLAWSYGLF